MRASRRESPESWSTWALTKAVTRIHHHLKALKKVGSVDVGQQAGGIDLSPITAEITYGLERIAMFLSRVNSVYDVMWNESLSYGQVRRQDEVDLSRYGFEIADVELQSQIFDRYEQESRRALEAGCARGAGPGAGGNRDLGRSRRGGPPGARPGRARGHDEL